MPAAATDNWEAVQTLAVALGNISEAARRCGVSIDAACQRARRENWQVGRRPAQAVQAAKVAHSNAIHAANPNAVRIVRTPPEIVSDANADLSSRSRSASLRYSAATLEHSARLATTDPEAALASAADVKAAMQIAQAAGSWNSTDGPQAVNVLNIGIRLSDVQPSTSGAIDV